MKTTVQALKELYATLGGDLADVALIDRVPDMIEALNSIAVAVPAPTAEDEGKVITVGEDGALGFADALPPVTAEDAGKVLAVDEQGVWNPAEASGGGVLTVKITDGAYAWGMSATPRSVSLDTEFSTIRNALLNGKDVRFTWSYHQSGLLVREYSNGQITTNGYCNFYYFSDNGYIRVYQIFCVTQPNLYNTCTVRYIGSIQIGAEQS